MKKILFIFLLTIFMVAVSFNCFAQEYYLRQAEIKVNIPDSYTVVLPENIPGKAAQDYNMTVAEFRKILESQNAIMFCYDANNLTELYFIHSAVQNKEYTDEQLAKEYNDRIYGRYKGTDSDYSNAIKNILNNPQEKKKFIEGLEQRQNWQVKTCAAKKTPQCNYIDITAVPKNDPAVYIRCLLTIRNGASFGINAISYSGSETLLDKQVENIISDIQFSANNSGSSQQAQPSVRDTAFYKGVTSALSAVILMVLYYLGKAIWNKFKKKPLPVNLQELRRDLASIRVNPLDQDDFDKIFTEFKKRLDENIINDKVLLYKQFEIELFNSILNAGFAYRGSLTLKGYARRSYHYQFVNLCIQKGYYTQQEANIIFANLENIIKNQG